MTRHAGEAITMPSSSLNNALLENAVTDIFNGVTVNMVENECELSGSEFQDALGHALGQWRQNGNRGVWFYVPFSQVRLSLCCLFVCVCVCVCGCAYLNDASGLPFCVTGRDVSASSARSWIPVPPLQTGLLCGQRLVR